MPVALQLTTPDKPLEPLARIFGALGEPARLRILNLIAQTGELCNCHLEAVTGYTPSKISRHLAALKHAGLVQDRRVGTWIHYSLTPAWNTIAGAVHTMLDALPGEAALFAADLRELKRRKCLQRMAPPDSSP